MKTPRSCIFCEKLGDASKEHIWPDWMAAYLPPAERHVSDFSSGIPRQPKTTRLRSERPGAVHSKKLRRVCRLCNNTWMSSIEEQAKPTLLKAFNDGDVTLLRGECDALSTWAVLKTLLTEQLREEQLTPLEERNAFRLDRVIPLHFRVFLGTHFLESKAAFERHAACFAAASATQRPQLPPRVNKNAQLVTLIVGKFYFHIASVRVSDVSNTLLDPPRDMARIFPSQDADSIDLPSMTALDMQINAHTMERLIHSPRVSYKPDWN